jgi:hypothetical protein
LFRGLRSVSRLSRVLVVVGVVRSFGIASLFVSFDLGFYCFAVCCFYFVGWPDYPVSFVVGHCLS